ncbi:MAG: hypothetical protein PHE49_06315 [bacterium]|nr:hypothetical protein [bacterium]
MRKILNAVVMCILLLGTLQAKQTTRAATNAVPIRVEEEAKRNTNNLHELNYQGWLTDAKDTTGAGITGTIEMIFRLYSEATGGKELWSEKQSNVEVDKGLFNAVLGSVKPIPADIFTGASLWLETQVGDDILVPRKKLASVGYAIKAEKATRCDTADFARSVINDGEYTPLSDSNHTHIGQDWDGTSGTIGLDKSLTVSTSSAIYCEKDEASNSDTGAAYGGYFEGKGSGAGTKYGLKSIATAPSGSGNPAYGAYGYATNAGSGDVTGGYFEAGCSGTGTRRGAWGKATSTSSAGIIGSEGEAVHTGGYGTSSVRGIYGYASHSGSGYAAGSYFYAEGAGTGDKYGIYSGTGGSGTRYAGYFSGNVSITGSLSKGSGSFLIDHPLDPMNKTLRHNFVESPENLCLYRGKVRLNAKGEAMVEMPSYFAALTKENEATVNLTPVGKPFQVGCEWETGNTKFTVYGEADRDVFYIVLADRDDPVMKELQKPVEEDKGEGKICKKGELLYPEAYGYSETVGKDYRIRQEQSK